MQLYKLAFFACTTLIVAGCAHISPGGGYSHDKETFAPDEDMAAFSLVRSPGTDLNLGMSWESAITVSRVNPFRVAVVQGNRLRVSTDGGTVFQATVNLANFLPSTHTGNGDGVPTYDSQGRLFVTFLGNPLAGGGWDVFVSRHDPTDGSLISGPVNVGNQVGIVTGMNIDKPWLVADSYPASPSTDRLYLVWSVTGGNVTGDWEIYAATSNDQGATWTASIRSGTLSGPVSPADASDGRAWSPNVAVAINGDVYISYHGQPGFLADGSADGISGQKLLLRSIDAGLSYVPVGPSFGPGQSDTTRNSQHLMGAIGDARFWTIGNQGSTILPDLEDPCVLHVVTADDPDDDHSVGDASDVVMATSTDCGLSFSQPQKVDDGPIGTWQVFPTAAIDPDTGAIAVTWFDNQDSGSYPPGSAGNAQIDLRLRTSWDGGNIWQPAVKVNDLAIDPDASAATIGSGNPSTFRIGEYNGVAFGECAARMVWAGNDSMVNTDIDTFYDEDPEAAGDFDLDFLECPDDVALGCNDSTDPRSTGTATARDNCDRDPVVGFFDFSDGGSCPPTPVIDNIFRTWTATDAAGNSQVCQQLISIQDFDSPEITVPNPIIVACDSPGGVAATDMQIQDWLDQGAAVDSCSEAELSISGVPAIFPVGCGAGEVTFVTFSAIDSCGNSGFEQSSVTVTDRLTPQISAPEPSTIECTAPGGTPAGDAAIAMWLGLVEASDSCSAPAITSDAPALFPAACSPGASTAVTFSATDDCGNISTDSSDLTVADTQPPIITVTPSHFVFEQPDHQYRCIDNVREMAGVADICQSFPVDIAINCQSNQCDDAPCAEFPGQDGDGVTIDDCTFDPLLNRICARAERAETDPGGRLYNVTMAATDSCGNNTETLLFDIHVPWGCPDGETGCLLRDGFESPL